MDIKKILVLGAGFMGAGIAEVFATGGLDVYLYDLSLETVKKAIDGIKKNIDFRVSKDHFSEEEGKEILARIYPSKDLSPAAKCQLVLESIIENKDAKAEIYKRVEEYASDNVIIASNTSSIPITELAATTKNPANFIGMHFFSPAPRMKLVEIISGLKTSAYVAETIKEFTEHVGKIGIIVKDCPGFLVNRISAAMRNEVYNCLLEGVASIEDIDLAMKYGLGHPMGAFELADFVGLDIGYAVAEMLYENFKDPKWRPSLLLKKLVVSGDLGRKTGKGWYDYTSGTSIPRTDLNL